MNLFIDSNGHLLMHLLIKFCLKVGPGVLSTLAAISDTFADTAILVKKYGIKFEEKDKVCDASVSCFASMR